MAFFRKFWAGSICWCCIRRSSTCMKRVQLHNHCEPTSGHKVALYSSSPLDMIWLQVSEAGDILYVLPSDFKARLRNRSLKLRLEPALKGLRGALSYLTRISFGTALIASVTLVWVAILAIQSGSSNRDDNRSGSFAQQLCECTFMCLM